MTCTRLRVIGVFAAVAVAAAWPSSGFAQRGGGGGGRGGGGLTASVPSSRSRLDTLDTSFKLTKEQKKEIKAILDEAHKSAAPVREGLTKTHAAIAAAVQASKSEADIDAAAKSYAEQTAAMMTIEMKALADVIKKLDDQQRANNAAISAAFFLMRGAFLDNKKWDDVPDGRGY